jgi:hypothetical protein
MGVDHAGDHGSSLAIDDLRPSHAPARIIFPGNVGDAPLANSNKPSPRQEGVHGDDVGVADDQIIARIFD